MKKKTQLSVRPVRRTKKPGYPSWQEPNPLEQPYAQPYPFTQKALNWLAASGLCGALFLSPEAEGATVSSKTNMEQLDGDTIKYPFVWEKMGLPYHTPMFGTGMPERLTEKEAKAVIEGVFRREGLKLEETKVKTANGTVGATGYDQAMKIGYVWLGYENTEMDLQLNPCFDLEDFMGEKLITHVPLLEKQFKNAKGLKNIYRSYSYLLNHNIPDYERFFITQLKNMIDNGEPDWKEDYKWMFYEHETQKYLYEAKQLGLPSHIVNFLSETIKLKDRTKRRSWLESAVLIASANLRIRQDEVTKACVRAAKSETPKLNISRVITIWFAMSELQKDGSDVKNLKVLTHALKRGESAWKNAAALAMNLRDERKVDKDEVMGLLQSAKGIEYSILPISNQDKSLEYSTTEAEIQRDKARNKASLDKFYSRCDSLSKDTLLQKREMETWEWCKSSGIYPDSTKLEGMAKIMWDSYGISKEQALKTLEKNVLDYINWTKQQRGY